MSEEPMPQEPIIEESAPPELASVTVQRPLYEAGKNYRSGDVLETTAPRAERLVELKLVAWPREARPWWNFWRERKPGNGRREGHV